MKSISVFAPASIGNIGPGLDLLGMAVSGMGDTVTVRRGVKKGVVLLEITGVAGTLPRDAHQNTAGIAAQAVISQLRLQGGIEMSLHKGVLGTGLGSSAASAVAAAYATNLLLGGKLTKAELIPLAAIAEQKVSGGWFLDNIGPAMMGGITWNNPFTREVVPLGVLKKAILVIAVPDFPLLTRESRKRLPEKITREQFIFNMASASMMSWAVARKDLLRFGRSIQDQVAEPARAKLIRGFADVKKEALAEGALGVSIAGAGASVFAVTDDSNKAEKIGMAMRRQFKRHHVTAEIKMTTIDPEGARRVGEDKDRQTRKNRETYNGTGHNLNAVSH